MSERKVFIKNDKIGLMLIIAAVSIFFIVDISGASPNDACFACHTNQNRTIDQSLYDSSPHKILECIDCHVNSISRDDTNHGQFIRQLNGNNVTGPLTTKYSYTNFSLCYYCHSESKVIGTLSNYNNSNLHNNPAIIVSRIGSNFINNISAGFYNGNKDYPTNIHWNHLDDFGSFRRGEGGWFDSNKDGTLDSYQSCPACHDVHGTNYPKMTKNALAISYDSDSKGTFGYIGSGDYTNPGSDVYCSACHTSGITFKYYRNETNLSEDCISCHATSSTNDFNITAFGQGVHLNINKTDGNGLVNNSDCWSCHYKKDMNRSNIYTCVNCHINGAIPSAPQITSHKPEKTNKSSCEACHELVKLDPGLNDIGLPYPNITSHYAQLPTVTTTNYCDNCHGPDASSQFQAPYRNIPSFFHNSSNVSFPGNTNCRTCHTRTDVTADPLANNNSNFHNMTTEYGDVKNNDTGVVANCVYCHIDHNTSFANAPSPSHSTTDMVLDTCYKCHGTKTGTNAQILHDVQADLSMGCVACHASMTNDFNITAFGQGVHLNINKTDGINLVNDSDCWTCHYQKDMNRSNIYTCVNCHVNGTVPEAPQITSHRPEKTNKSSCEACHELVKLNPGLNNIGLPYPNITSHYAQLPTVATTNYCDNCHGPDASSLFQAPYRNISSFFHNSSNASFPGNSTCRTCHTRTDVTADPLANNNSNFHNMTTEYGDVKNNTKIANCVYCHVDHDSIFSNAPTPSHSTIGMVVDTCYKCHGTKVTGTNAEKLHDVQIGEMADCISCHESMTNDFNITAFGKGVHQNINKTDGINLVNNSDCWTCHYQKDMNRSNIYTCVNCHVDGIVPEAPKITSHKPEKTNKSSCEACHELVKVNPGPYPNITSHYAQLPTVTTTNYCDYCHGPNASSLFQAPYRNIASFYHNSSNASFPGNSTCRTCHTRTDVTADPLANNNSNFHNMTTEYGDVKNNTKIANCVYCHLDHDSNFSNAPSPSHSTTDMVLDTCYVCHGTKVIGTNAQKLHDVQAFVTTGCIQCHVGLEDVNASMFGRHKNLNTSVSEGGLDNMTDADCKTCHFGSKTGDLPMISGGANHSNTYECDDCHKNSSGVVTVSDPTLLVGNLKHGSNKCISCHAPDMYHVKGTAGPRGRVENPGWQLISTVDYAGCLDCHLNHNGLDAPFNGPGIDPNTTSGTQRNHMAASGSPRNGSGCKDSCHLYDVHRVTQSTNSKKPTLSTPVLFPITVGNNEPVEITTRGSAQDGFTSLQIEAAQYRINNSIGQMIVDWTAMTAQDGRFNSSLETVNATINTTGLSEGTYNVSVRVMASGPKSNILPYKLLPYYPINGDWSNPLNATFIVKQSRVINGTVRNNTGSVIPGADITAKNLISGVTYPAVTDITGFYSLSLSTGIYDLTAGKDPEYYINNTIALVDLESDTTATRDIIMTIKPIGTISGVVRNV